MYNEKKLEQLIKLNDETLEDYGWGLEMNEFTEINELDISELKLRFISEFISKCCNGIILENSDSADLIRRINDV